MKRPYPILVALICLILFSLILIFKFIPTLLLSAIIAYIFFPLYNRFHKYVPSYAAIISCTILILIISVPALLLINSLIQESFTIINLLRELLVQNQSTYCTNTLCETIQSIVYNSSFMAYLQNMLDTFASNILQGTSKVITNIPKMALELFIFLFTFYYCLKDGKSLVEFVEKASKQIRGVFTLHLKHMDNVMKAIVHGYFFVAMLQGILALLGYIILGVPNPFFWGFLTAIFALVPLIGTALIWAPLSIMLFIKGISSDNLYTIISSTILFAYGAFIISTIDNVVRPNIIAARVNVHPLTILLGIIGGLQIVGPAGFIIGPVLLSTTIRMVQDSVNQ